MSSLTLTITITNSLAVVKNLVFRYWFGAECNNFLFRFEKSCLQLLVLCYTLGVVVLQRQQQSILRFPVNNNNFCAKTYFLRKKIQINKEKKKLIRKQFRTKKLRF